MKANTLLQSTHIPLLVTGSHEPQVTVSHLSPGQKLPRVGGPFTKGMKPHNGRLGLVRSGYRTHEF